MSFAQCKNPKLRVRSNSQKGAQNSATAPYRADASLADTATQSHPHDAHVQDPFTYYKAFVSSDVTSTTPDDNDDGDAGITAETRVQTAPMVWEQQQSRPRTAPYHLAVRFANRSNGAPLATIVERRSVSTLSSRGSLLSVGRFPSLRTTENVSPGRAPYRASRSFDEKALKGIKEETHQENNMHLASKLRDAKLQQPGGEIAPFQELAAPACPVAHKSSQPSPAQPYEIEHLLHGKGLKGLLRGALHGVRGGSRNRSDSSSTTNANLSTCRGVRPEPTHISPQTQQSEGRENAQLGKQALAASAIAQGSHSDSHTDVFMSPHAASDTRTRDPQSLSIGSGPSAGVYPPILHLPPPTSEIGTELGLTPHLPPVANLSRPREGAEPMPTVRHVLPEPRDVTQYHVHPGAATLRLHSRDELPDRYTLDGIPFPRSVAPSLPEYDHARDTSRNASFCSTMSTSYSSTVLGVDLDLQHEFPHPARRSAMPVWFTPKECIDHALEPPKGQQGDAKQFPPRSITSSALSALLPIAAAEGIVHPNSTTPKISFYSPSGILIQAESSSPPSTDISRSNSYFSGTPTTPTSFYNNTQASAAYDALSASTGLPPARPAPVPMTTPPQSFAPLPEHLRHHHNYQQPERSQITPESTNNSETTINPGLTVKGCGGVVRPHSLTPRSGIRPSSTHAKHNSSSGRSMSCFFDSEASRSRRNTLSSRSQKGRTLKKRAPHQRSESGIGQITGHTMRACFCQPYDGTSQRVTAPVCRVGGLDHDEVFARQARDTETPNARVVDGEAGKQSTETRTGRVRSDSGVSTGTSIRVCCRCLIVEDS